MLFSEWDRLLNATVTRLFRITWVKNHDGSLLYYFLLEESGRQALVTLSTAETELVEMVDGGWNVSWRSGQEVLVREVFKKVRRVLWSLCHFDSHQVTGGNWRTRHLKMRSSYTRLAVMRVAGRTQGWRGYDYRHWNEGIGIPTI